jgi:hypothetical protein
MFGRSTTQWRFVLRLRVLCRLSLRGTAGVLRNGKAVDSVSESTCNQERPMLGSPKPRRLDEPIAVSLEDLVPQDHFYRHLEANLDLGFVRDWVQKCYADRDRPARDAAPRQHRGERVRRDGQ